jgi:membrane protein implicated in regulation of membrane protease activity
VDEDILKRHIRFGSMPSGNPLANALMLVVAALAVGAAIVLGFVAFIVFAGIALVLAAIVGIRLWWFSRKLGREARGKSERGDEQTSGRVIEGEYTVVSTRTRRKPHDD